MRKRLLLRRAYFKLYEKTARIIWLPLHRTFQQSHPHLEKSCIKACICKPQETGCLQTWTFLDFRHRTLKSLSRCSVTETAPEPNVSQSLSCKNSTEKPNQISPGKASSEAKNKRFWPRLKSKSQGKYAVLKTSSGPDCLLTSSI